MEEQSIEIIIINMNRQITILTLVILLSYTATLILKLIELGTV